MIIIIIIIIIIKLLKKIIIIIMKNFNRRRSHGDHGSKRRELAHHAHSRGSHAFAHTLCTDRRIYLNLFNSTHQHSYNHVVLRSASSATV